MEVFAPGAPTDTDAQVIGPVAVILSPEKILGPEIVEDADIEEPADIAPVNTAAPVARDVQLSVPTT
jgi:hypothetical protein